MRVLLAIPHALLREGLQLLLKRWSGVEVIAASPSIAHAARLAERLRPDALVLTRGDRPAEDAQAIQDVRAHCPKCQVLLIEEVGRPRAGHDPGADRSIPADVGPTGLMRVLSEVAAAGSWGERTGTSPAAPPPRVLLTRRECDVVRAVCEGLGNREIAQRLAISEQTVRNHLSRIYRRTKASGRTQLLVWAIRQGFWAAGPPS